MNDHMFKYGQCKWMWEEVWSDDMACHHHMKGNTLEDDTVITSPPPSPQGTYLNLSASKNTCYEYIR